MGEIEKKHHDGRLGALRPSAELRGVLSEIENCKDFFERGGIVDYLQSINEFYIEGKGSIKGPVPLISFIGKENVLDDLGFLNLDTPQGGVEAHIEWEEEEDNQSKSISVQLLYSGEHNFYSMFLYAGFVEKKSEGDALSTGGSIQRNFWLNPNSSRTSECVDDILLTFAEELLESGIL